MFPPDRLKPALWHRNKKVGKINRQLQNTSFGQGVPNRNILRARKTFVSLPSIFATFAVVLIPNDLTLTLIKSVFK